MLALCLVVRWLLCCFVWLCVNVMLVFVLDYVVVFRLCCVASRFVFLFVLFVMVGSCCCCVCRWFCVGVCVCCIDRVLLLVMFGVRLVFVCLCVGV